MTVPPKIPDLPQVDLEPAQLRRFLETAKEIIQTREGRRGNELDRAITFRDLSGMGLAERIGTGWVGVVGEPGTVGPPGPPGTPYVPDYTPPPTPANLRAVSMLRAAFIEWDPPTYTQGNRNAYTRIFVAQYGGTGPLPTFANAVATGQVGGAGTIYVHEAATGARLHIWATFVTNDGVESPVPAGGLNGVQVEIGADVGQLLDLLTGEITSSQLSAALNQEIGLISAPSGTAGSVASRILQEANDRAAAVLAEATARGTAISNEATIRQSADNSLAQSISLLTAGVAGGFDPGVSWYFDAGAEGWASGGATQSWAGGEVTITSTGTDPVFASPTISPAVMGGQYATIKARVRRLAGSGWKGLAFYQTPGHGHSGSFYKQAAAPSPFGVGDTAVVEWDMTALTAGGADWVNNNILSIRLDFGNSAADAFAVDWVAIGRNAPGASVAALQTEQLARIAGDQAEAAARTTLAARVTTAEADINTTEAAIVTEQSARASGDAANASSITALTATVNGNNTALNAAIVTEQSARASGDAANASLITTVQSVALRGANLADVDWWTDGATPPGPWALNGSPAENSLVQGIDHTGKSSVLWRMVSADAPLPGAGPDEPDGGWYGGTFISPPDRSKTYRFVLPVKRVNSIQQNQYWGINGACDLNTGAVSGNPYFAAAGTAPVGEWLYFVGYMHPAGSTGKTNDGAGIFRAATGEQIATGQNWTWHPSNGFVYRAYLYYGDVGAESVFGKPMIHLVDGSEPPLESLLLGSRTNAAAIQTEVSTRASETGHLSAQYVTRVQLTQDGRTVVGGFGIAGTSDPTQGPTIDFGVVANRFWVGAPAGTPGVSDVLPFIIQAAPTTINGQAVPAGVYMDTAFIRDGTITTVKIGDAAITNAKIVSLSAAKITAGSIAVGEHIQSSDYAAGSAGWRIAGNMAEFGAASIRGQITAAQINSNGLSIRDNAGNIILAAGAPLAAANITPSPAWLNSNVGAVNMLWGAQNGPISAGPGAYGQTIAVLKNGATNTHGLRPGEALTVSADLWQDAASAADGATSTIYLYSARLDGTWTMHASIANAGLTPARSQATMTLPATDADIYNVIVSVYHQNGATNVAGTVFADRIQVERGVVATQYKPGAEPGATFGAVAGSTLRSSSNAVLGDSQIMNAAIAIDAAGTLQGIGTGVGTAVANNQIGLGAGGQIVGIGAGAGTVVSNNQLALTASGQLTSAGSPLGQTTITGLGYNGDLNATNDLQMVLPASYTQTGGRITKASGAEGWNSMAYAKSAYVGGAYAEMTEAGTHCMVGLTNNPGAANSYPQINYAAHTTNGDFYVFEGGAAVYGPTAIAAGARVLVQYDGSWIRYSVNGVVVYQHSAPGGLVLHACVALFYIGQYAQDVRFGPYGNPSAVQPTNPITPGNITTYISGAAIGYAQINTATITNLAALNAFTGQLTVDSTGHIKGGATSYSAGVGFWIGNDAGTYKFRIGDASQYVRWTGTALEVKLNAISLSANVPPGGAFPKNDGETRVLGTVTVTASGGTPPYAYAWTYTWQRSDGYAPDIDDKGSASFSGNQATLYARGDTDCAIDVSVTCIVNDANGLSSSIVRSASGAFGTGPP